MAWNPKHRYKPIYYQIMRLDAQGFTGLEIADMTGYNPATVYKIIKTDEAQEIGRMIRERTIDSILTVQADFQAIAPMVLEEKIRLALTAKDERIRSASCTEILDRAGHAPRRSVELNIQHAQTSKYDGKTEAELRDQLLVELGLPAIGAPDATVH